MQRQAAWTPSRLLPLRLAPEVQAAVAVEPERPREQEEPELRRLALAELPARQVEPGALAELAEQQPAQPEPEPEQRVRPEEQPEQEAEPLEQVVLQAPEFQPVLRHPAEEQPQRRQWHALT